MDSLEVNPRGCHRREVRKTRPGMESLPNQINFQTVWVNEKCFPSLNSPGWRGLVPGRWRGDFLLDPEIKLGQKRLLLLKWIGHLILRLHLRTDFPDQTCRWATAICLPAQRLQVSNPTKSAPGDSFWPFGWWSANLWNNLLQSLAGMKACRRRVPAPIQMELPRNSDQEDWFCGERCRVERGDWELCCFLS